MKLFSLLIFFYSIGALAQNFTGTVKDGVTGEPVADVRINMRTNGNEYETLTDFKGRFEFKNTGDGVLHLKIRRLGYIDKDTLFLSFAKSADLFIYPSEIKIDNINITASRSELTLKQTPSSINVIDFRKLNPSSELVFDDVLRNVQGITVFKTCGINVQSLSIRGSSDVAGGGIGNRVLLLVDGRPSLSGDSKGALWSLVPLSLIEKTEVVKGAFSSLYGSNAIGGVINVITKKPSYMPFTMLSVSGGFYQKLNDSLKWTDRTLKFTSVDFTNSNTLGKLAYLFNFNLRQNDGHAEQTAYKFMGINVKLMYDVLRNRDLSFTFQYTKSDADYPHYWRKDSGKRAEPFKTNPTYIGDKIYKNSLSTDLFYTAVPSPRIKYNTRFYAGKISSISYYNPNNFVAQNYGRPGEGFETYIGSYNLGNISQVDFQLSRNNYLISGLEVEYNIVRSSPDYILYGNQQSNSFGIYLHDRHILITGDEDDILSLTLGARTDYINIVGFRDFFQISPKVSLLFTPSSNFFLFKNSSFRFLVGRAFRTPSIAELYFKKELFGGFDFVFNPQLKPEKMVSAEAGFKKQFGKVLLIDISFFINKYDDLIQYVNIGGEVSGPFQVQNIAKSQIKGIEFLTEFSSSFPLFKKEFKLSLGLNYTFTDSRDLSVIRKDEFLPYKPRHILNFSSDFEYEGFKLSLSGKYLSKIDEVIFFKYEEPDEYFLADLKISKSFSRKLSLFFSVNNVFDAHYQELERIQSPNRRFSTGFRIEF